MSRIYTQLSDDEKAALSYNMLYQHHSRKAHPELFGDSVWHSSFYKRLSNGEESLKKKGILGKDRAPSDLAYDILPTDTLRQMAKELREELMKVETRRADLETKHSELKANYRDLQEMEKYKLISEIADKFSFLGVDENWIAVLISTNLVEQAMKKKLEELGIPLKAEKVKGASFRDIVQILGTALKEKENRRLETLIKPKPLYDIRSKIVHAGYKMRFSQEEAQAIYVLVKNVLDGLWPRRLK